MYRGLTDPKHFSELTYTLNAVVDIAKPLEHLPLTTHRHFVPFYTRYVGHGRG